MKKTLAKFLLGAGLILGTTFNSYSQNSLSHISYKYDAVGNVLEFKEEIDKNNDGIIDFSLFQKYEYNSVYNILKRNDEVDTTGDGIIDFSVLEEYKYDPVGNKTEKTKKVKDGAGKIIFKEELIYEYDAVGNLIKQKLKK